MEYCAAGSIIDIVRITKKALSENEIATVLYMALKGIEYLHETKKIHRDIKAGNILLDDKGNAKLADFGVAAQLQYTLADQETVIGTPFWMSPEILSNSKYNKKTDIWSLGITAIELAEGEPPYSHIHPYRAMIAIKKNPPQGLTDPQSWSEEFSFFIKRCLTIDPKLRPNAKDLLRDPFIIKKSKGKALIYELVIENLPSIDAFRAQLEPKTQNENSRQTNDFYLNQAGTILNKENNGTMIVYNSDDEEIEPGTLVINENVEVKEEPDFLKYYKESNQIQKSKSPQTDENEIAPEFRNMDPKILRMKIERLRKDMEIELKLITDRYIERISSCEKALDLIERKHGASEEIVYNRGGLKYYDKEQEKAEMNINIEYNRIYGDKKPLTPPASTAAIHFPKDKILPSTPSYDQKNFQLDAKYIKKEKEQISKNFKNDVEKMYTPLAKEAIPEKPKPSFFDNTKKTEKKSVSPESPTFNNLKQNLPFEFAPYEKMKGQVQKANQGPPREPFTKFSQQLSNQNNTSGPSLLAKAVPGKPENVNLFEKNLKAKQDPVDETKKKIDSTKFKIPDFMKNAGKSSKEKEKSSPAFMFQPYGGSNAKLMK